MLPRFLTAARITRNFSNTLQLDSHTLYFYENRFVKYANRKYRSFARSFTFSSFRLESTDPLEKTDSDKEAVLENTEFNEITRKLYIHPGLGHNILLIQPRVKSGPHWETKAAAELKLAEAVSLINTLPNWKVVEKLTINVASLDSKLIFGKGNLEKLKQIIQKKQAVSAVFIGIDIMTALQNSKLEQSFRIPAFDRYQIILQIFHDHAHTKEAKLQLALAEIPYLRVKLCGYSHTRDLSNFSGIQHVGGDGETYMEMRRRLLNEREIKLKKALEKVKNQRQVLRHSERRISLPVIAVVGYTNCGKTTLIKSLTNDSRLHPEDKLFATLDVTLHTGLLPSNQKALFIDTVGFISDVPTALIQSFRSTLEEITLADIVVHVRDISHPDAENQKKTVLRTLEELDLPTKLLDTVIEANNKVDLLKRTEVVDNENASLTNTDVSEDRNANFTKTDLGEDNSIFISATEGTGLPDLLELIEQRLFENTGHSITLLRVRNGGEEYNWLLREAAIRDAMADERDANYLILEVVISQSNLSKFQHRYGNLTVSIEDLK